jgi:hypothetical protein
MLLPTLLSTLAFLALGSTAAVPTFGGHAGSILVVEGLIRTDRILPKLSFDIVVHVDRPGTAQEQRGICAQAALLGLPRNHKALYRCPELLTERQRSEACARAALSGLSWELDTRFSCASHSTS